MGVTKQHILWLAQPEDHDYPAAMEYLTLKLPHKEAEQAVAALRAVELTVRKAKDIFRASGLSLLGVSNSHVLKNVKKIRDGKQLSPILLVVSGGVLHVADGYHRLCAVYGYDEDAYVPCKLVSRAS